MKWTNFVFVVVVQSVLRGKNLRAVYNSYRARAMWSEVTNQQKSFLE